MSKAEAEHTHDAGDGPDWWKVLDIAIWAAVVVIAALAIEWLVGMVARERMTAAANRVLQTAARKGGSEPTTE